MKLKFLTLTFLLLFARGCDFYSTGLWFFDDPSGETNPLSRYLGFGWNGLVIVNVIVCALIILSFYFYSFRYTRTQVPDQPENLRDYISERYFRQKGKFYQIFYKTPTDRHTLLGHVGYVLIRVVIIGSFLASIHNLCQYYQVPAYSTFREIVGRPLFVIYGLLLLSMAYFSYRIWNREYQEAKAEWLEK